jgi:membrane protease YdiL (CAAX protease family)
VLFEWSKEPLSLLALALLLACLAALWINRARPFLFLLLAAFGFAAEAAGRIRGRGIVEVAALFFSVHAFYHGGYRRWGRAAFVVVVLALCLLLQAHLSDSFQNLKLAQLHLSARAVEYSLYVNFDKALTGIVLLTWGPPLAHSAREWKEVGRAVLRTLPLAMIGVGVLALALRDVAWDPKLPALTPSWALLNLSFTCVAEEALFRGFIQRNLSQLWHSKRFGNYAALVVAAVLFGAVHLGGGLTYAVLATIAGLFYGGAYLRSGRIEASILTHFGLNLFHWLFLTYPALFRG